MKMQKFLTKIRGFLPFLETTRKQVAGPFHGLWKYEPDKREIRFTNKVLKLLKDYNLSESYALDVYYHGFSTSRGAMIKKYPGYEIGVFYMIAPDSGVVIITHIWKKDRR